MMRQEVSILVAVVYCSLLVDAKSFNQAFDNKLHFAPGDPTVKNQKDVCPPTCPRDCKEIQELGYVASGVFTVYPTTDFQRPLSVYCDMMTSGGGWLVFQRRQNGQEDFYQNWTTYEAGFGHLQREFWLGNSPLQKLLDQRNYRLRVDLQDFSEVKAFAEYEFFSVGCAASSYRIGFNRFVTSSTAGNSLGSVDNLRFSTPGRDNDLWGSSCADQHTGAWWYGDCSSSNLNGVWTENATLTDCDECIFWYHWKNNTSPIKETEMKFRPM